MGRRRLGVRRDRRDRSQRRERRLGGGGMWRDGDLFGGS